MVAEFQLILCTKFNNNKETTMALTKETQIGKIEVVGKYKSVQVRTDTVVMERWRRIIKKVS